MPPPRVVLCGPGHQGGSAGVFIGPHLRPRADRRLARDSRPGEHGRLESGWIAVRAVVPDVADHAVYEESEHLAAGMDDVFVAGVAVLRSGELTGRTPGAGLRRSWGGNR